MKRITLTAWIFLAFLLVPCLAYGQMAVWTNSYDGVSALAVDSGGNVLVVASDLTTLKYSGAGAALWTNYYHGPVAGGDTAYAIAVDASGSVIVTGISTGIGGRNDIATIQYSGAGVPVWTNRYNRYPSFSANPHLALTVDADNNVIVASGESGRSSLSDFVTIKYSSTGKQLWNARYDGPADYGGSAFAALVDASGNVIVTGNTFVTLDKTDYATIKYSNTGVALWTNLFSNGLADRGANVTGAALDASGNVFVTGEVGDTDSNGNPMSICTTVKISSDGALLWVNYYEDFRFGTPSAIAVNAMGNVFVTGYLFGTIAYSNDGALLWTNNASANAIAVDPIGNVFVVGYPGSGNPGIIAYSNDGAQLWTEKVSASAIAVDGSGNVFVTGFGMTIKYSSTPSLSIGVSAGNMTLSWPTNAVGFTLQSSPDLSLPSNWSDSTNSQFIAADQYFVTNVISGNLQFYRLKK